VRGKNSQYSSSLNPSALDVEEFEAGDALSERQRVNRELRDRPIGPGVRLVIENVYGAVANLKKVNVAGDGGVGRRIGGAQQHAVLPFQFEEFLSGQPNGNFDGKGGRVVGEREPLKCLVPQPVVPYRRDDQCGHCRRRIFLVIDDEFRGVGRGECRLRSALAVAEELVGALKRDQFEGSPPGGRSACVPSPAAKGRVSSGGIGICRFADGRA
jgi:hypothetical protein